MISKLFQKKITPEAAADNVVKKRVELEALETDRTALLAARLEAEDTGADTSAAEKKLAENTRRREVAQAAVDAAKDRLVATVMAETAEDLKSLPAMLEEYLREWPETIAAGMKFAELAARYFECAGQCGELAQRVRESLIDRGSHFGAAGVLDEFAQLRAQGALQAEAEIAKNPLPDLARMRQRISDLKSIPGDKPAAGGHFVQTLVKRALGAAQRRAGKTYDGFKIWREKQNARLGA